MTYQIRIANSLSRHRCAKHPRHDRRTEQRRIVAKVEQVMALVDEMETQLAAFCATATNLVSDLVAELTTQA